VNEQGYTLKLYQENVLLGVLTNVQLDDFPWYSCNFQPTVAFEPYKPLFDLELKLLEDQGATEAWDMVYEEIEALNLRLVDSIKAKSTGIFLIHIEGEIARFKAVFD
jgi:hypothetical protein